MGTDFAFVYAVLKSLFHTGNEKMSQAKESKNDPSSSEALKSQNDSPQRIEDHSRNEAQHNAPSCERVNVGDQERIASTVGGAVLAAFGMVRSGPAGWVLVALGAGLVYRGTTGHCSAYKALNVDTARSS